MRTIADIFLITFQLDVDVSESINLYETLPDHNYCKPADLETINSNTTGKLDFII